MDLNLNDPYNDKPGPSLEDRLARSKLESQNNGSYFYQNLKLQYNPQLDKKRQRNISLQGKQENFFKSDSVSRQCTVQ